ncbi:MAG: DUF6503 family protein [Bacteroidota bacterium]
MKNYVCVILLFLFFGCASKKEKPVQKSNNQNYKTPAHHIKALTKVFDAHGGYENWHKMKTLSYNKGEERTITNLQDRKTRLESPNQTIGFDGKNVWVSPDSVDVSRARFYHNLYFYFFAMPFVVGDPGAFYEVIDSKEINGKMYEGLKISYNDGVGDSPEDNYIIWSDPETDQMEWLMYTVTYRSKETSDNYRLIRYADWKGFNGVVLPQSLQWYQFSNDSIGDLRSEVIFENIELSTTVPDPSIFEMPENAQVAPR